MTKAMTYREANDADLEHMLSSDEYAVEPKLDGVRCIVRIEDGKVRLLNRHGEPLAAASTNKHRPTIQRYFETAGFATSGTWMLDGELMADGKLWLYDLPIANSMITPATPFDARREALTMLAELLHWEDGTTPCHLTSHATSESDKRALVKMITDAGGEGVMLKKLDAPYVGKRVTHSLKWKIVKEIDVIITARNTDGHTNAELSVYCDDGSLRHVGNCSMNGKPDVPVGTVIVVRFLYVGDGGRLYQPRMMAVRTDKTAAECMEFQLNDFLVNKSAHEAVA